MTADQIRKRLSAVPFRQFEICLADGRAILVEHAEVLGFDGGSRSIVVFTRGGIVEVIDLMLVLSLRFHEPNFVHSSQQGDVAA